MAKRPAFQFYPADWKNNANLRRCTLEERGAWIEIMCLLHDSDQYGVLSWPLEEISLASGVPQKTIESLIRKGVLKGTDDSAEKVSLSTTISKRNAEPEEVYLLDEHCGPVWYSSRMVRDEFIRKRRGDKGLESQKNPNVPRKKGKEKDTFSRSPTSTSTSTKEESAAPKRKAPSPADLKKTLEERKEAFRQKVLSYRGGKYGDTMLKKFFLHYSSCAANGYKMAFEKNRNFDLENKLESWHATEEERPTVNGHTTRPMQQGVQYAPAGKLQ